MAARIHSTFAENPKGQRFPVWDGATDRDRSTLINRPKADREWIEDYLYEHGATTQWLLTRDFALAHPQYATPASRVSAALLILRHDNVVRSTRDATARRSPRSKPFFSPLWELVA